MLATSSTTATGILLLLTVLLCRLCNSSRQLQQQNPQQTDGGDQALLEIDSQPVDLVLQSLAKGDMSVLIAHASLSTRQYLVQRLFNRSSRQQRTLRAGIDLCWSLTGVSCVCAHLEREAPIHSAGDKGSYTVMRDFVCASVLSPGDCAAASKTGGCARCPPAFERIGLDCIGPECVATCQCRCSGATWPSQIRPCSAWCSSTAGQPQCPSGGSVRSTLCHPAASGVAAGARAGAQAGDEVTNDSGLTSKRVWNSILVCAFLLMCLVVVAYGCRLCGHCSRLWSSVCRGLDSLRSRLGIDFSECELRLRFVLGLFGMDGIGGGGGGGGGSGGDDDDDYLDNGAEETDYDSAGGHGRRRRWRDRRGRERTGSFLSLSCAESINVVSPTDLILPSYREQPLPSDMAAPSSAAPPTYEQAQQQQQLDLENPPPPYSELFEQHQSSPRSSGSS